MLCDPVNRNFRSQLAAVWEKLTKAALAEIGNLADECSSVLHTEISLHKSENEALKKRCYSLEVQLRAARESQSFNVHGNGVNPRNVAGHQQTAPSIEGVYGKDWCMDLWRDEKRTAAQRKGPTEPIATTSMGAQQVLDLIEREPDLIFIKEEIYDDAPIGQQIQLPDIRKNDVQFGAENMLHRVLDETELHSADLNSFSIGLDGSAQQRSQQNIMDKLIEDAAMSHLVDTSNPPSVAGDYLDYMSHMNTTTNNNNNNKELIIQPKPMKPVKRFQCLFCGKVFNYMSSLKVHIRRHSGEKPFSCTVCGKRFAQKTYLKLHQRVHSGEKPYSCPGCGKSFSQKSSLNIHIRTHTGEKPYSCVDCGKCYAYKYGLNHHQCLNVPN